MRLAPGDPPLTLAEVAAHYRMTERQLRKVIRERGVEVLRAGHTVRFDAHALKSLEEKLRAGSKSDPESSTDPVYASSMSRTGSRSTAYEDALRMTAIFSRRKKPPPGSASADALAAITRASQRNRQKRSRR
jgi:hypothetical protein